MRKLLIPSLVAISLTSQAQNDSLLQHVDVFGEKAPTDLFEGQHIEVLSREQIEATPVKSVNELLEFAGAVDVRQRGPYDVQADVSVRGGTFDQTLILLNGVPMNDPQTGHHNMNLPISIDDIERIEVLHGGGSHRYGPYAFSGAINIITKKNSANAVHVEAEGGEYAYLGGSVGVNHNFNENLSARVGVDYAQADGYLTNTDFNRTSTFAQLNYHVGRFDFDLQGGFNNKGFGAQNFYSSFYPTQYEATSTYFGAISGQYTAEDYVLNLNVYNRVHADRFELYRETGEGYYSMDENAGVYIRGNDTAASWYAGPNFHRSFAQGGELSGKFNNVLGTTLVGFDLRNEMILSNNLGTPASTPVIVPGTEDSYYTLSDSRLNSGAFINHRVVLGNFDLQGSLRYNMNTAFGNDWLPGVEVAYAIPRSGKVYASYNRSFRLPTFTDLYYRLGGAQGSIDLQPEYSHNYEVGYSGSTGIVTVNTSMFLRDGTNMIDWVVLSTDSTGTLRAQNITNLTIYGVDADMRIKLGNYTNNYLKELNFSAAFLNSPTGEFDFESLYALDYLAAKVSLGVVHELGAGFTLSWQVTAQDRNGTYVDFATGETTPYAPIALLDARLSWEYKNFTLYADGNNLLDVVYVDRGNVMQPGRWLRAGVRWNLEY